MKDYANKNSIYYSFDYQGSHFVILNTDSTDEESLNMLQWLKHDLSHQQGQDVFVFGHKPLFTPDSLNTENEDINPMLDSLWQVVVHYSCDIYFGSHIHRWGFVATAKQTLPKKFAVMAVPIPTGYHAWLEKSLLWFYNYKN